MWSEFGCQCIVCFLCVSVSPLCDFVFMSLPDCGSVRVAFVCQGLGTLEMLFVFL